MIFSDGSAQTWKDSCGHGAVLVRKTAVKPMPFAGAWSYGSSGIAEVLAVAQPLVYLAEHDYGQREHGYRVDIFSDSTYVVAGINKLQKDGVEWVTHHATNRAAWMMILATRLQGLVLRAHHVPRDTAVYNKVCHDLANFSRLRGKYMFKELREAWGDLSELLPEA